MNDWERTSRIRGSAVSQEITVLARLSARALLRS